MNTATKTLKLSALATALVSAGLIMSTSAFAGGTTPLTVNAKITAVCKVTTAPGTLDFGSIDPSGASAAAATPATFTMKCSNGTVSTAATDGGVTGGLHAAGGFKRMQHSATGTAFLPYTLSYSGDVGFSGTGFAGAGTSVTVNGSVAQADYAAALATTGAQVYTDTVTITVNP